MIQRKSIALQAVTQVSRYMRVPRLESIRSRILALAVLGTLLPTGITLGVAYNQNRRAREAHLTQNLQSQSTQTARATGVWFKERLYDLRVFASSQEVSSNLARFATVGMPSGRLREYLRSVHERFTDFDQLLVLDTLGRVLASSAVQATAVRLPAEWQKTMRQEGAVIGDAYWDSRSEKGKLIVALPVLRADGRVLGAFAAELSLSPVQAMLNAYLSDSVGVVYLANTQGALLASSREISADLLTSRIAPRTLSLLSSSTQTTVEYIGSGGLDVVGSLQRVPQSSWVVIAEVPSDIAFAQLRSLRNLSLAVIALLLLIVSATAYWLGVRIVRPLERLAEGAAEVSAGDLGVNLPHGGGGEVGALTAVFNDMVNRLREHREELERLSHTDGLTGLLNHRSLMQRLAEETQRSARNKRPFALLMMDVDNFKQYNDAFGHPAGDEVLRQVATVVKDATRSIDCVARYGGEEFAVLLPETGAAGALELSERIRARISAEKFPHRTVTLSIGLAEFPGDADSASAVVGAADSALYEAKRAGRNCVVRVGKAPPNAVLPPARRATREAVVVAKAEAEAEKKAPRKSSARRTTTRGRKKG